MILSFAASLTGHHIPGRVKRWTAVDIKSYHILSIDDNDDAQDR